MTALANHQKIVVGVDGSANSIGATRWAAAVSSRLLAPLHLLCVYDTQIFAYREFDISERTHLDDRMHAVARAVVDEAARVALASFPDITVTTEVSGDFITRALLNGSDHARMLVVGRSGLGSVGSALVGSTTQIVVDQAGCPVVVWGGPDQVEPGRQPIVVGVDGSESSTWAVEAAFVFAAAFTAPVAAVHTWSAARTADAFGTPLVLDRKSVETNETAILSESLAGTCAEYPQVAVTRIVREANSAETLLKVSSDAQLIVVGSRGHTGLFGPVAGSTSRNLLHHATVPVMICRPPRG